MKIYQISKFVDYFIFYFMIQQPAIQAQSPRLIINEFMASNDQTISDEGGNFDDWIEIYNNGEDSANVKGFFLTDNFNDPNKWAIPDTCIPPKAFFIIWADADSEQGKLHTNFKLSANGEQIGIFYDSLFIDSITFKQQKTDISYGRYPDASSDWYYFTTPTPGRLNNLPAQQPLENPIFFPSGGFFHDSLVVAIRERSSTATIRYTLDCSSPTEVSQAYSMPIKLARTSVIRAKAFEAGYLPSDIITHGYIVNKDFNISTLSLVTDPPNLWNCDSGIYMNPNKRGGSWERPVAIELYDPNDQLCFSTNAGIRISGEASRDYEKKAFRLYFKSEYGPSYLEYSLFHTKKQVDKFKRLSIHAGSTDMPANPFGDGWTLLRDPLMYELGRQIGCLYPGNMPVAVFLNGEPWGIYNFMERIDKYFAESNFGELDVDLIENNTGARDGDMIEWEKMISFLESHDLRYETNYEQAKSTIDIQNFTNYHILEIFGGNGDWTHHNVFAYRPRKQGAVWRWILWDMDGCFGPYGVNHNTLEFAARDDPATLILRKLIENQNYQNLFINRFADLLNSTFTPSNLNQLIDSLVNVIKSDIAFETNKWGSSPNSWEQDGVNGELRDFAEKRSDIVWYHIKNKFDLDGEAILTIASPHAGNGQIRINSIIIRNYPWSGRYFKNLPIELEAIPAPKYLFTQWSDSTLPQASKISIVLTEDFTIAAEFVLNPPEVYLIINEINYNSSPAFDPGDWIELYNPSSDTVNLSDWCFIDDDNTHKFILPESTKINPFGYLVLCQNQATFHACFPEVIHYIGDFDFGLSADGDVVRIFNSDSYLIDSVKYDDATPWQTAPDGYGPTLELIDPDLDNNIAENWQTSIGNGTPGRQNSSPGLVISPETPNPVIPNESTLFQNFPNPFNAGTRIRYDLSMPAHVQIIVYNFLGEEIKTVVNKYHSSGSYVAYWEGKDNRGYALPSGIYFYQMKAGNFSQIRKIILVR